MSHTEQDTPSEQNTVSGTLEEEILGSLLQPRAEDRKNNTPLLDNGTEVCPSQERWNLQKAELDRLLQSYDGNHGDAIAAMEHNVATYVIQGEWLEAELLGERVVKVCMAVYGQSHEDTLVAMGNLAMIYATCRRWSEEEKLRQEIVAAWSAWQGEKSSQTIRAMDGSVMSMDWMDWI